MVCSTAILTSSLALSLLRISSNSSESIVLSPFSLNSALSIIHDGANGTTQQELTNLLLNGCSASEVTDYYSSRTLSLYSNNRSGVTVKSANRFYVNKSISLKNDYQKHVESKYQVKVESRNFDMTEEVAREINAFVDVATKGKIRDVVTPGDIKGKAILVNAMYFFGKWKDQFSVENTHKRIFKSSNGDNEMQFMQKVGHFRANFIQDFGTLLILPYEDATYSFFYLLPHTSSSLEKMRNELTGQKLIEIIKGVESENLNVLIPKFTIESELNGVHVLKKLGVKQVFRDDANLSKISSTSLKVSGIKHKAMIETNEVGTKAAAVTRIVLSETRSAIMPYKVIIDRPFLFGILRNEDILFIGQFMGN